MQPADIAVIFDWDGVIIDSHDQHEASWFRLAEELGHPFTQKMFDDSFGMRNESIIPDLFAWAEPGDTERIREIGDRKEVLYREVLQESGIEPLEGVRELLRSLKEAGIPRAVGTSTARLNVETVFAVTGLGEFFDAISATEDVTRGKPEPDVFLNAARLIEREPARCVVFEDAHVGLEAGRRAGMKTVGVATTDPAETLQADVVIPITGAISVEKLRDLVHRA